MSDVTEQLRVRRPEAPDLSRLWLDLKKEIPSLSASLPSPGVDIAAAQDQVLQGCLSIGWPSGVDGSSMDTANP